MDVTTSSPQTVTCATPGCGEQTTLADSTYIDGCGRVCAACAGPLPDWWGSIDPPF